MGDAVAGGDVAGGIVSGGVMVVVGGATEVVVVALVVIEGAALDPEEEHAESSRPLVTRNPNTFFERNMPKVIVTCSSQLLEETGA